MTLPLSDAVTAYVEQHITIFHERRLEKLHQLALLDVLSRKNPYLFRAKNMTVASDLVRYMLDAYLTSQEETLFGNWLEGLAVFICGQVYAGVKPPQTEFVGIDLVFAKAQTVYAVEIKSGPNWGNSSQIKKMEQNFATATQSLMAQYPNASVVMVNGCMYGRESTPLKTAAVNGQALTYYKICGQDFWTFISGDDTLYTAIIQPLGHQAKMQNESFQAAYDNIINRFTAEVIQKFCLPSGEIEWERLINSVSARAPYNLYPLA
jgi:hypothetical protein